MVWDSEAVCRELSEGVRCGLPDCSNCARHNEYNDRVEAHLKRTGGYPGAEQEHDTSISYERLGPTKRPRIEVELPSQTIMSVEDTEFTVDAMIGRLRDTQNLLKLAKDGVSLLTGPGRNEDLEHYPYLLKAEHRLHAVEDRLNSLKTQQRLFRPRYQSNFQYLKISEQEFLNGPKTPCEEEMASIVSRLEETLCLRDTWEFKWAKDEVDHVWAFVARLNFSPSRNLDSMQEVHCQYEEWFDESSPYQTSYHETSYHETLRTCPTKEELCGQAGGWLGNMG